MEVQESQIWNRGITLLFFSEHWPVPVFGEALRRPPSQERQAVHVPTPKRSFILPQKEDTPPGCQTTKPTHQWDGRTQTGRLRWDLLAAFLIPHHYRSWNWPMTLRIDPWNWPFRHHSPDGFGPMCFLMGKFPLSRVLDLCFLMGKLPLSRNYHFPIVRLRENEWGKHSQWVQIFGSWEAVGHEWP